MYVYQLAKELLKNGHECLIISVSNNAKEAEYDGLKIKYIPFIKGEFQESENPNNLHDLISLLDTYNPDIFHLHTLSPSLGASHLMHLKNIGYKVLFTAHLPNFTCTRGDLLQNGIEVCDGKVDYKKCMRCELNKLGVRNNLTSKILSSLSSYKTIQRSFPALSGVTNKIKQIDIFKQIDTIITVSNWQRDVLLKNNFDANKISVVRQSVTEDSIISIKKKTIAKKIVFGFIGRVVPEKGFHLLYKSFENITREAYEIRIAAIKSPYHAQYYSEQKDLLEKLPCTWLENISSNEVLSFLDELDVLLVPSAWLETGPYVIYEALARKVPVIAFNKGGATELIENEWNSILVETEIDFRNKISKLIMNPELLPKYISNININRTTANMYKEMESIYAKIF